MTLGDNDADCSSGSPNCYLPSGTYGVLSTSTSSYAPAYKTQTGWDFSTGIGTVNVYNLVTGWAAAGGAAELLVSVTGSGTVTSNPSGISCPSTCSAAFHGGPQVTLTATPASGWTFSSWGGACSGTGSCIVAMNAAQSASARRFVQSFDAFGERHRQRHGGEFADGHQLRLDLQRKLCRGYAGDADRDAGERLDFDRLGRRLAAAPAAACVTMNAAQSVTATFAANPAIRSRSASRAAAR